MLFVNYEFLGKDFIDFAQDENFNVPALAFHNNHDHATNEPMSDQVVSAESNEFQTSTSREPAAAPLSTTMISTNATNISNRRRGRSIASKVHYKKIQHDTESGLTVR